MVGRLIALDEIDLKIIRMLSQDARMPFYKVAKEIGISPRTVELRFRKLVEKRVILRATVRIDLSKIGYVGKAFIYITTSHGADKSVIIDDLKKINGIFLITPITGNYDILALLAVKDFTSVFEVRDHIGKLPCVEKADISFVQDTTYPMSKWINNQIQEIQE